MTFIPRGMTRRRTALPLAGLLLVQLASAAGHSLGLLFGMGDGVLRKGADMENSGVRGANVALASPPILGVAPYDVKFARTSGERPIRYLCFLHDRMGGLHRIEPHRFLAAQLRQPSGRFGRWVMTRGLNDGNAELIAATLEQ